MKVFISQLYIQPGVSFPFSHHMQSWLHEALSALAVPSPAFTDKYGADFNLIVRLSAKRELKQNEIKGPTVFKKEKDVEYTLLLPFEAIIEQGDMCRAALAFLFDGVRAIFARSGIEAPGLDAAKQEEIIEQICSGPDMLDGPWPAPRVSALH
jgi:hypothetical protein